MEDLIKRTDAIQELAEYLMMDAQKEWAGTASEDIEDWKELAETVFDDIPSAEKHGEWIFKEITDDYHVTGLCSVCKERRRIDNFCPNCGARMKGAER